MNTKARAASRRLLLLSLLVVSAAAHASAQAEGNPPNWCRNGAFPSDSESFRIGRVKGRRGERAYFHKDAPDDCPRPGAKCRGRAYLVPGNEVVVSRTFGDWACAWYQPARGPERVGWVEAHRLDFPELPPGGAPPARLVGEWTYYENFLNIRPGKAPGRLAVEGQAYWHGLGGNVHVGEVAAEVEVSPSGSTFAFEDDACRVAAHLVGDYLVVNDNGQCGGVNVSFDGVYRKKTPGRRPASRAKRN